MVNTPYGEHVEGGGSLSLMTLADLIRSSATIHSSVNKKYGYSMAQAIQKQFGTIYYNNKVVVYNEQSRILEIRMGIGTKTEKAYKGMHSVRLAIYGVEGTIYNSLEELYRDKTGMIEDVEDMNKMTKALQGKGNSSLNKQMSDAERERNANLGNETNKFTLSYGTDPNAQLSGYVVPVAAVDPDTGAYTYNESGRIFYMENGIDVNSFVRVSCSCSSYYFTMGLYNFWAGAHLGQAPAPYPGKNPNSDTIMNETKSPGLCKHLMMLVMLLLDGGILSKIGTKGFSFNLQDIRNRTDKLQIPRKLADERDWANHARQLQRTLRNADKKHIAQFHDRQTAKDVYREYEKSGLARNSIEFNKFMSTKRAAGKDILYGNTPLSDFARDALDYMNSQDYQKDRLRRPKYNLDLFKHYK